MAGSRAHGREGLPSRGAKTVDLTFQQDGHVVGVDIIELHESDRHARQHVEMGRIVNDLQLELAPLVRELSPGNTIAISWAHRWLPSRRDMRAGLEMVKSTILKAAAELRAGDSLDLEAESLLTSRKNSQLKAFDDARVLAIDRAVMGFHEDLREAIAAQAHRIPANWSAIYFVVPLANRLDQRSLAETTW